MTRIANLGEAVHLSAVQKGKERADRFESRLGLLELSLYAVTINNTLRSADFRVIRGQQQLLEVARRTAATLDEGHSVRVFFRGNQVDLGQWNERQLYTIEPLAGSFSVYSLDQEFLEERDLEGVPKTTYSFVVHGRRGADIRRPSSPGLRTSSRSSSASVPTSSERSRRIDRSR
ncbi:MAG: hypothetical protein ACLGI3_11905 [Actinomycetes bacterium]